MGIIGDLLHLLRAPAESSMQAVSAERRKFREDLVSQLREYSVLVERVRSAFLSVYDLLPESTDGAWLERSEVRSIQAGLESDSKTGDELVLPPELQRFMDQQPMPRLRGEVGATAQERIEAAIDQVRKLESAWSELRPRLDEALEASAVAYLRTYRHEFRRLANSALEIVSVSHAGRLAPDPTVVRMYCEAVLVAADHWNSHVVGTIDRFTPIRRKR